MLKKYVFLFKDDNLYMLLNVPQFVVKNEKLLTKKEAIRMFIYLFVHLNI